MSLCSAVHQIPNTILFLTRSLERGGAERQLVVLSKGLARREHAVVVAVFYGGGAFEADLLAAGVRLIVLDKRGRWDLLPFFFRLLRVLRRECPTVLHAYLTVPNLLAALCKPFLPGTRIVWGLRASNMDLQRYDWLARLTAWLEARFSRLADRVIANSQAGKLHALRVGFREKSIEVIHNGIDTERFCFDAEGRGCLRAEWGIKDDEVLVGLAARLDPMKDHPTFLAAASIVAREYPAVRFVCVGGGAGGYADTLKQQAAAHGLGNKLVWAGPRDDMPAVFSAFDIAVSASSFGEGFSNTLAEAMACGLPCVATDVGDSALIVGAAGAVVPTRNPDALARAIGQLVSLSPEARRALGEACRARVTAEFGIERLVERTEHVLEALGQD
jgi:glycosyltransferase involved in cell wall biosynthesis